MKIEYKVKKQKKSVEIIDPNWSEYCQLADYVRKLQTPSIMEESLIKNVGEFVQLYTGKTDEEMSEWGNSFDSLRDFIYELDQCALALINHINSKKK